MPVFGLDAHLDSTISLKEFSVVANRYNTKQVGQKQETIDTTNKQTSFANNLSDILSQNNSFFVKSYGLGGLSTGSFRGTSASQTATLWNGFNLQSPMNGVLDYSLVPSFFMDEINLSFGGASSLFGSGSIGGTVLLSNKPEFNKGIQASLLGSAGSFDNYQQAFKLAWSNSKTNLKMRAFHHQGGNHFPFINTAEAGKPKHYQQNAKLNQSGVLFENYNILSKKQQLNLRFWYQNSERQVPAAIISSPTKQSQMDVFYRGSMEWTYKSKSTNTQVRAAYFDEKLHFKDPAISLDAVSRSRNLIAEAEGSYYLNEKLFMQLGYTSSFITATSDGYGLTKAKQNRNAVFASVNYATKDKSFQNKLTFRKEVYGSKQAPLTLSFGTEKLILNQVKVRGNISKNYRIPTFNDLFWTEQGAKGNKELMPESSWGGDLGIGHQLKSKQVVFSTEVCGFSSEVKNMIVWQPTSNAVWSPHNISVVWSRGFEAKLNLEVTQKAFTYQFAAKYNYTKSTDSKKSDKYSATYGKQIFYVPLNSYNIECSAIYKGVKLTYRQNYTGKRYTNNEETEYLPGFETGTVLLAKTIQLKKMKLGISFQVLNVWSEQYQVIAWRPMPLVNYQASISLGFN